MKNARWSGARFAKVAALSLRVVGKKRFRRHDSARG